MHCTLSVWTSPVNQKFTIECGHIIISWLSQNNNQRPHPPVYKDPSKMRWYHSVTSTSDWLPIKLQHFNHVHPLPTGSPFDLCLCHGVCTNVPVELNITHFMLFYLFNCISIVTRCRYSRGWTNGRKRADPALIQLPQPMMMRGSHPTLPVEYTGTAPEDWSRNRVNDEVNHFQITKMNLLIFLLTNSRWTKRVMSTTTVTPNWRR